MVEKQEFSKYERARIIGARGLQVSMDAPVLMKLGEEDLHKMNYDPLRIAEKELDSGVLPISVKKPLPKRKEESLEKIKVEPSKVSDEEKIKAEEAEEKDISESGEMMELSNPSDEADDAANTNASQEEPEELQ